MSTPTWGAALGALFSTVGSAAGAVSSTFETGTKSVTMLERYVDNALTEQRKRQVAGLVDLDQRIAEEKAQQMSERGIQVLRFCDQSEDHARLYKLNYARVMEALHPTGSSTTNTRPTLVAGE